MWTNKAITSSRTLAADWHCSKKISVNFIDICSSPFSQIKKHQNNNLTW